MNRSSGSKHYAAFPASPSSSADDDEEEEWIDTEPAAPQLRTIKNEVLRLAKEELPGGLIPPHLHAYLRESA